MRYQVLTVIHKVKAEFHSAEDLNHYYDTLPPEEQFFYAVKDTKDNKIIPGFVYMSLPEEKRFRD